MKWGTIGFMIIGSNERYHTWMDEGLNDYSNIRYWEDKYMGEMRGLLC